MILAMRDREQVGRLRRRLARAAMKLGGDSARDLPWAT